MLKNVDATVRKETAFTAGIVLIGSMLLQAVYLIGGWWNITVLWGNLLGAAIAVGNFFLLGLTVQKSLTLSPEEAQSRIKISQQLRLFGMLALCGVGAMLPCFDLVAMLVPLLFPRIAVSVRGMMIKREAAEEDVIRIDENE